MSLPVKGMTSEGVTLPDDIEREIFIWASLADPIAQLQLILVSRQVHSWIEPLIWRNMDFALGSKAPGERLTAILALLPTKSSEFLNTSVKVLFIDNLVKIDQAVTLLRHFRGLTHLALWLGSNNWRSFNNPGLESRMPKVAEIWPLVTSLSTLQHLSLNDHDIEIMLQLHTLDPSSAFLANLTTLDLGWGTFPTQSTLSLFTHLKRLSFVMDELAASSPVDKVVPPETLKSMKWLIEQPTFQLLIAVYEYQGRKYATERFKTIVPFNDPSKIVVLDSPNWSRDWRAGVTNGTDMWYRAERLRIMQLQ